MKPLTGIVLAGGRGSRIGGDKDRVVLDGRTLLDHAVAILHGHCRELIVAGGVTSPRGTRLVRDPPGVAGPLRGLAAALAAARGDCVLVLACDLPLAGPAVAALAAATGTRAIVASAGGRSNPLCARYPRRTAARAVDVLRRGGESRASVLSDRLGALLLDVPEDVLVNVNTPADLQRAVALMGADAGRPSGGA